MAEPGLHALERAFHARVSRALAAPQDAPLAAALASVRGDARASPQERLAIYERMYFHRLHDILRGDFPRVLAVLGEGAFRDLVADYLLALPPNHPSVRNAGARLAPFVRAHAAQETWPWLADLAALERARVEVFDAADSVIVELDALRALPPEGFATLVLRFVAAHVTVALDARALDVWRGAEPGEARRVAVFVWRGRDWMQVHHRVARDDEREVSALLESGATFGAICEALGAHLSDEDAVQAAARALAQWVDDGLVAHGTPPAGGVEQGR